MPTKLRRDLIDLGAQRAPLVQAAEDALNAGNHEEYTSAMQKITNLNTRMTQIQNLIAEKERNFTPASGAELNDMIEDRANTLKNGGSICFDAQDVQREIFNAVTVGADGITQPAGANSNINDRVGVPYSSIIDQVSTIDLTGVSSWQEPYVITETEAKGANPATVAGKPRNESSPTFGVAELRPYDVSVTSYVDRNIANLTPTAYYQKVYSMAMDALRRELARLIINGDGAASPIFYGLTTAKNKKGENIFATQALGAVGVETLDDLYYAYGDDEFFGGDARLLLTKPNLKALGKLRGANEKKKLFNITREMGHPNIGMIEDGGTGVPFTLAKAVGDDKLLYGDPVNFMLGLFGGYSVRIDESYKAGERLITVLGDVQAGGNLIRHNGFVVGTIAAAAAAGE